MSHQSSLNFLLPLRPDRSAQIAAVLQPDGLHACLRGIETLHFLALAVVPVATHSGSTHSLLLEANIDDDAEQFLQTLWGAASAILLALLEHCDTETPASAEQFIALLARHDQGQGTAHTALPGVSLSMIRQGTNLHRVLRQVHGEQRHNTLNAEQGCDLLLADTRVQDALFATPSPWPGERVKQWRQPFAVVFSVLLVLTLLSGTALSPLPLREFALPGSLLLTLSLIAILALFTAAPGSSAVTRGLFRLAAIALLCLVLYPLCQRDLLLLPLFFYGYAAALFLVARRVLNSVPTTDGSEQFLKHGFSLTLCSALLLALVAEQGSGLAALAAQQGWLLVQCLFLLVIARVQVLPLPVTDSRAMVVGALLFLLSPFPVPPLLHTLGLITSLGLLGIVCVLGYMNCLLQAQEQQDPESPPVWQPGSVRSQISLFESQRANRQNHLISVTRIKPGFLRRFAIRLVLTIVGLTARLAGKRGELSGIVTIHFARWILVGPDRSQLLFISNYCGNWDSYLDEFIDHASGGLTSIWSNTVGFPRSHWLSGGGARAEQRFKLFARRSQVPTLYHYSAYPELTVDQIEGILRLNTLLRANRRSREECEEVLRTL